MSLFKKKETENAAPKKAFNLRALKHGSYVAAIIAVVLVAVIVLNICTTLLENNGYLKFDMTLAGDNTISEENREFIENIDTQVNITVLCNESEYADGTLANMAESYLGVASDANYYAQTLTLLKQYAEINDNVKVSFTDFYGTKTKTIGEIYPSLFFGDLYIEITEEDGTKQTKLVGFEDIYPYSDQTGMAQYGMDYYYIDGNDIETALTSAINNLISGNEKVMGVLAAHSDTEIVTTFYQRQMELNGFTVSLIEDTIVKEIPEEVSVLVIAAPDSDLLPEELDAISKWLDNDGKYGRSLMFLPGTSMNSMPNLSEFLEEWGIKYNSGVLYQTDDTYHVPDAPTTMAVFPNESDISDDIIPETGDGAILGGNLPMEEVDPAAGRTTNVIVSTNDMTTIAPADMADDWTPDDDALLESYPNLIVTSESTTIDGTVHSSYVSAFSSYDFIYSSWTQYSDLHNMGIAINTARFTSGMDLEAQKLFVTRTITNDSYANSVTAAGSYTILIVFVIAVPVTLIIIGVVVWIRRRKR